MNTSVIKFDENKRIWTSPNTEVVWNTNCPLGKIIYNQMKNFGSVNILIDHSANVTMTKHDALIMGVRIAQQFNKMQLNEDDIIGFAVKNTTYVVSTVIACLFNCIPFHAVNSALDQYTMEYCFNLTKPKVIFCDSDCYQKVYRATLIYKPKIIIMSGIVEGIPKITDYLEPTVTEKFYEPKHYSRGGDQIVAILCSSGTTGKPKAVCLSSFSLIAEAPYFTTETISYNSSSIDWITGLSSLILSCITGITRIIVDRTFNADDFIMLLKRYRITHAFLPPRHISALIKHPEASKEVFSSLLLVQTGGSPLSEQMLKSFRSLLNDSAVIITCYGTTEFGLVACNVDAKHFNSVGKLVPNLSLRIVDDVGQNLGHNEVGEILVNNGKRWGGYYGQLKETQQMRDDEGWFHTGDSGFMDDENYLYVVDRKKEIRKYQGFHFWPKDIEEVIVEMPGVKDACIITIPDESVGDISGALVVKELNSSLTEQEIIDYVKKRWVNLHMQIHAGVVFVDEIPQTLNGKTIRLNARRIFEAMSKRSFR